jgi:hypothetical protein
LNGVYKLVGRLYVSGVSARKKGREAHAGRANRQKSSKVVKTKKEEHKNTHRQI